MRWLLAASFALLLARSASAATLQVEVNRNGFTDPIEIALAPRLEGMRPQWSETKTLAADASTVTFSELKEGLYLVLLKGAQPLQRLSAKVNLGSNGSTLRLVIPKSETTIHVTLAGQPIARAAVAFTHEELRWHTELQTDENGRYAGPLWEPGVYSANVGRARGSASHLSDVTLTPEPLTIDVPNRHVTGRVVTDDGTPLADAQVTLRSESDISTLTSRTKSDADGRFEFFGVRAGAHTLTARATSYLDSDAARFELRGATGHSADLVLTRGEPRTVRVVDARGNAIAGATLFTSCDGHMKSMSVTNAEGRADVAVPARASCAMFALPQDGSIAIASFGSATDLLVRVREGSSSLRLTLKSEAGEPFSEMRLLMRIDGMVVPPEIARLLPSHGFTLRTNEEGSVALARIPSGTYEFWPYRTPSEGQMLYEASSAMSAPIVVNVVAGENDTVVRFKAR